MSFHFYLLAGAYVVAGELVDFLQLIHRGVVLGGQLREGLPFLYGDVRGCFGFLPLAFLVGLAVSQISYPRRSETDQEDRSAMGRRHVQRTGVEVGL